MRNSSLFIKKRGEDRASLINVDYTKLYKNKKIQDYEGGRIYEKCRESDFLTTSQTLNDPIV